MCSLTPAYATHYSNMLANRSLKQRITISRSAMLTQPVRSEQSIAAVHNNDHTDTLLHLHARPLRRRIPASDRRSCNSLRAGSSADGSSHLGRSAQVYIQMQATETLTSTIQRHRSQLTKLIVLSIRLVYFRRIGNQDLLLPSRRAYQCG